MQLATRDFTDVEQAPEITTADLAGFRVRLAAYLIDVGIVGLASWGVAFATFGILSGGDPLKVWRALLAEFALLFVTGFFFYSVAMLKQRGQTLGKLFLGIKVVRTDASRVDWNAAVVRFAGYLVSWSTLHVLFLRVAYDAKKQGLHDRMAGTYVIVVPKKLARAPQARSYATAERVF
ncbi:MAG: RDD family protein [Chloroflexi bacterium]|nr:RDD family protein [Chloroflexota bacterium]